MITDLFGLIGLAVMIALLMGAAFAIGMGVMLLLALIALNKALDWCAKKGWI